MFRLNLRTKIISPILGLAIIALGALFLLYNENNHTINAFTEDINHSSTVVSDLYQDTVSTKMDFIEGLIIDPLYGPEPDALNIILIKLKKDASISSAFILDGDENVLADGVSLEEIALLGKPLPPSAKFSEDIKQNFLLRKEGKLLYSKIIESQGEKLGRIQVTFSLDKIETIRTDLLNSIQAKSASSEKRVIIITAICSGIFMLISMLMWFASSSIIKPIARIINKLQEGTHLLGSVSSQIAESSDQVSNSASAQAASIEETSSSLEMIQSRTVTNLDLANEAVQDMNAASQGIDTSNQSMDKLVEAMDEVSRVSGETSKIVKTIDEIAFQTNLLALNAAVEAARAGEAGAGFAVVADEVRTLALRAAEAATNSSDMIEKIVSSIDFSTELVSNTKEAFTGVQRSTGTIKGVLEQISSGMDEQKIDMSEINQAMATLETTTTSNASIAEETAAAVSEINNQSNDIDLSIMELESVISGK